MEVTVTGPEATTLCAARVQIEDILEYLFRRHSNVNNHILNVNEF